jgi:hypothetical protein
MIKLARNAQFAKIDIRLSCDSGGEHSCRQAIRLTPLWQYDSSVQCKEEEEGKKGKNGCFTPTDTEAY